MAPFGHFSHFCGPNVVEFVAVGFSAFIFAMNDQLQGTQLKLMDAVDFTHKPLHSANVIPSAS